MTTETTISEEMKAELVELVTFLITTIGEEYRGSGCEEDTEPSMDITIGFSPNGESYGYQTGDNSYTGGAYSFPIWAIYTLTREDDPSDVVNDLIDQFNDQANY